ncbi:MAG: DedA family protein [bacterium]
MDFLYHPLLILRPDGFRALVQSFGLPLVCTFIFAESGVFPVLPGDSLLVVCGMFAVSAGTGSPALSLWSLLVVVPICAVLGSQAGFGIGRWAGPRVHTWRDRSLGPLPIFRRTWLKRTEDFFGRWGSFSVVAGRWVPFVRTFAPLLAGVSELSYAAYIPFNILGAFSWVWTMVLTGYYLPPLVDHLLPGFRLEDHIDAIVLVIVALSVLPVAYTIVKERIASSAPVKSGVRSRSGSRRRAKP